VVKESVINVVFNINISPSFGEVLESKNVEGVKTEFWVANLELSTIV